MPDLPNATTAVSNTAGAAASGTDVVCVISPVATHADATPRRFGNADAAYQFHGYSEGVEYAAYHVSKSGKPFIFIGLPIATAGAVGRLNSGGNTGSCVVSATAGASGVLGEHGGVVLVDKGGTIGTDQIRLKLSLDDGTTFKPVRLGTGNSYVIPYVGVTLAFAAGTLVTGDTVLTWSGSAPRSDAAGWANARTALASQLKFFRSALLCGDLQTHTEAQALLDQFNAYETANKRFTRVSASVRDRLPLAVLSQSQVRMSAAPVTFLEVGATGDTVTRSSGSFLTDGFVNGDFVAITGSASNNVSGPVTSFSATVLTFGSTDLANEGPVSNVTILGSAALTFASHTCTRSRGSWLDDGFRVGQTVVILGTASNNVTIVVTAVTATVLTAGATTFAGETIGSYGVSMIAGELGTTWIAAVDAEFAPVNGYRIGLAAGRQRIASPFSAWNFRRPANWISSARQYQHDLHIPSWRKADGPTGGSLTDANGTLTEWDDRTDIGGEAASQARFTSSRTWSNGPAGAFISLDLTRGDDGSLLSEEHNVDVVNLACTVNQLNTELAVGQSLVLNDDGTATKESLTKIATQVNDALAAELLTNKLKEGPRASKALWTPSTDDVLNVPDAKLTGVLGLNLNGTIHEVFTSVVIRQGGS